MQYRLGELFCGPGGIAWGATHADIGNSDYSIVHQWANDYDAKIHQPIKAVSKKQRERGGSFAHKNYIGMYRMQTT